MHVLDLRGPGPDHERWRRLCARSAGLEGHADDAAREVIAAVRERGDAAVAELTLRFEGRTLERFELTRAERTSACEAIPTDLRDALQLAADNIRRFHATQLPRDTGLHTDDARLITRAAAAAPGRRLCAGRHRGLPELGADDGDPRQGGRRRRGPAVHPATLRGRAARRRAGRRRPHLRDRRRPGDRRRRPSAPSRSPASTRSSAPATPT